MTRRSGKRKKSGRKKKWIRRALGGGKHRGALHRHYGISMRKKIPLKLLVRDRHAPGKLGQRVRFALGRRGYYKKKRSRSHRSY